MNLPDDLAARLATFARVEGRSVSEVVSDAVQAYLDKYDQAYRAEARRQSANAAARGWTKEDHFWESVAAFDQAEPPTTANAAE